jgi:PAS domain S-box-containing protein
MKANTALSFVLAGTSLWMRLPQDAAGWKMRAGNIFGFMVVLICGATLIEYIFGVQLGIDQLLFTDLGGSSGTTSPGRMAPTTATAFVAIGLALLLLNVSRRNRRPSQVLSLGVGLIAMMALSGYLYHATASYKILMYTQIALHTAIGLFLISTAIFFARPRSGIAGDLTGPGEGSAIARRFIPGIFVIPLMFGWLCVRGQFAGMYGSELNLSLFASANVVVFGVLIWLSARKINAEYEQRSKAEITVRELNADLENRVEERTKAFELQWRVFDATLSSIVDFAYTFDREGRFLYANGASLKLWGMTLKDAVGKNFFELPHTRELAERLHGQIQRVFATGEKLVNVAEYTTLSGGTGYYEYVFCPVIGNDGTVESVAGATIDVTTRQAAEAHLVQMESRYRGLLEAAPDAMVVVNQFGEIVLLNLQAEKQFGYRRDELIGQQVKNLIPEGFAERLIADGTRTAAEALAQQIGTGIELTGRRKDGSEFPIEIMLSPLESKEGVLVTAAIRDITVRKATDANQVQMESRYRGLLEAAPDAMVVVNQQGDIVLLNVQAEQQFGYHRDELIGQQVKNLIPEGFAERLIADGTRTAAEALAQQIGTGIELTGRRKDGSEFPIEIMLSPLQSAEGILVTAAIRDITTRKAADVHLVQMEARYRGLLEAAPDAMVVVNQQGEIVLLNVQAEKQFGYHRDELIGQQVKNLIPDGFAERLTADALRSTEDALAQQIGTGIELIGRRKDESEFPLWMMLSPLISTEGTLVTTAIRDITTRKEAEAQLKFKVEELSRSNEELERFAYIASHDLQEPLRMVASFTQLLSRRYKGKLDSNADEYIAFAVDGANRMQRLIQDLLLYSRVGTTGAKISEISSDDALSKALLNLRSAIAASGAIVTHTELPSVIADETQLIQLFQNLVGNAIKYQSPGIPRIHIAAVAMGQHRWEFSVKDNGLGIEERYFERIFGMFQRLHKREEFDGTGIGLAICKKIVERHGSTISVTSEPGQGSTFSFGLAKGRETLLGRN